MNPLITTLTSSESRSDKFLVFTSVLPFDRTLLSLPLHMSGCGTTQWQNIIESSPSLTSIFVGDVRTGGIWKFQQ